MENTNQNDVNATEAVGVSETALSRVQIKTLKEMEGETMLSISNESNIMLEYPFVWKDGNKVRLNSQQWSEVYSEYWDSSSNEGFWLMKEAKEEFAEVLA